MSERIDRLLDHVLASAPEGETLVVGDVSLRLADGRERLRAQLAQLDGEGAWHRSRPLGALEARWVPPASKLWRTESDDILARDGSDYIVIDATGAIRQRFEEIGMYPVAYVPAEDVSGVYYEVKDRAFLRRDWEVSDIGIGSGRTEVVFANLLADHDPETARFVAIVLGDAKASGGRS